MMDTAIIKIAEELQERFGLQFEEFRGDISLTVPVEKIVEICQVLKDEYDFNLLAEETAVDYWPQETPRFHLIYILHSLPHNVYLPLRVPVNGHAPSVPTLTAVYPNANWHERETFDMFGVRFDGHPDLRPPPLSSLLHTARYANPNPDDADSHSTPSSFPTPRPDR